MRKSFAFFFSIAFCFELHAQVRVACSSNLLFPLEYWIEGRDPMTNNIDLIPGATTGLYHQMKNGAPYDIIISADPKVSALIRSLPDCLESKPIMKGFLVIWSSEEGDIDPEKMDLDQKRVALANPESAPFGALALGFLEEYGYLELGKPVFGDGVSQVNQFILSGSVDLAFTSNSFIPRGKEIGGNMANFKTWTLVHDVHLLSDSQGAKEVYNELLQPGMNKIWTSFHYLEIDE